MLEESETTIAVYNSKGTLVYALETQQGTAETEIDVANLSRGIYFVYIKNAEMEEVAYFDTVPDLDSNQSFRGAWNVYPFFDNGTVIISDINSGIFILKVNLPNDDLIFESGFESN